VLPWQNRPLNNNKTLIRALAAVAMAATLGLFGCSSQMNKIQDTIARAQDEAALSNQHCFTPAFDPRPFACEAPPYKP